MHKEGLIILIQKNITMSLKAENVNCEKQGADDQAQKYIHIF